MMQLRVTGTNLDVGDALRSHVATQLEAETEKYFSNTLDASVSFARDAHLIRAQISVHVGRGILLQGQAEADSAHLAFDNALERIGKQLRRHKRRLRDHHRGPQPGGNALPAESVPAQQFVLAGEPDDGAEAPSEPVIIAEMETPVDTLTVGEAVMRMDLGDLPAMLFRNAAHGGVNMIYRRQDGNIGWIDPETNPDRDKRA